MILKIYSMSRYQGLSQRKRNIDSLNLEEIKSGRHLREDAVVEPVPRVLVRRTCILASLYLVFSRPDPCHLAYTPSFRRYSWLQRSPCPHSPRHLSVVPEVCSP